MISFHTAAKIIAWRVSGTTGASAEALCAALSGVGEENGCWPHDAGDFGRCVRFIEMVPELRSRIKTATWPNKYWAQVAKHWDELEGSKTTSALLDKIFKDME